MCMWTLDSTCWNARIDSFCPPVFCSCFLNQSCQSNNNYYSFSLLAVLSVVLQSAGVGFMVATLAVFYKRQVCQQVTYFTLMIASVILATKILRELACTDTSAHTC